MEEIKVENQGNVTKKISIFVPNEKLNKHFDNFYKGLKNKVVLKGFRKNHIPRSVLENQFNLQAKSTVSQSLFSEYYNKALTDNSINPVSNPNIMEMDRTNNIIGKFDSLGYSVDVLVEVLPELNPIGYNEIELKFQKSIEPELILKDKVLELQERFAERMQVTDRPAQLNDMVVIDFIGTFTGVSVKELTEEARIINCLGGKETIDGFDDNIIGMNIGESKVFDLKFPKDYNGTLAEKTVQFNLTLKNVISVKKAEINEDLALMAGFNTIEEMNEAFMNEAKQISEKTNKENLELQIISKLIKENKVEIPRSMIQQEFERTINNLKRHNVQINEQVIRGVKESAAYSVARYILVEAIYNKESALEITPDELDLFLEKHAKISGKEKSEFLSLLQTSKQLESFMNMLKKDKVLNFIIKNAKQI